MIRVGGSWIAIVLAGFLAQQQPATAEGVDLKLLLAVDVSMSVDPDEYALQLRGIAKALRHPDVIQAIRIAAPNGVAMALMQWGGPREQAMSVPWTVVRDQVTAEVFAAQISGVVRPATSGGTAIGDALSRGLALLNENRFESIRQVIDLSGDGRTNQGNSPGPIRARAARTGITINGLVILNEEPQLDLYYLERVVGGPGAFVLPARDFDDFARAIRIKLIREIAGDMVASVTP
jgi:hypothetical protein